MNFYENLILDVTNQLMTNLLGFVWNFVSFFSTNICFSFCHSNESELEKTVAYGVKVGSDANGFFMQKIFSSISWILISVGASNQCDLSFFTRWWIFL